MPSPAFRRLSIAAIWAVSLWPLFNFLGSNWDAVVARGLLSLTGSVVFTLSLAVAGHLLYRVVARRADANFVVVGWLLVVCLFFGYATIRDASDVVFEWAGLPIPPFVGFFLACLLAAVLVLRFRTSTTLPVGATIFCLGVCALSFVTLVASVLRYQSHAAATTQELTSRGDARAGRRVNAFYIILDAYPGRRGLTEVFGFDNAEFLQHMKSRGFEDVSTERSNYLKTAEELGAIFSLDYPQTESAAVDADPGLLYPTMFDRRKSPMLLSRLRAAGYTPWHSASIWGECPGRHFQCLGESSTFVPGYVTQVFLAKTPLGRPILHILRNRQDALSSIARDLDRILRSNSPTFVFGHHLSPHPPYLVDAQCEPRDVNGDGWNAWDAGVRDAFLESVRCVNRQVETLVDAVLRLDPDALIVLQGDHGSAFTLDWNAPIKSWPATAIRERMSFLNLVHPPRACRRWLDRPLGQINTARFAIACIEGRDPDYLPERTYLGSYAGPDKNRLVLLTE